jgi:phosphopantothenoylcysteine decarboxylase
MANILLGVTGSVAALRTPALHAALVEAGHTVKIVATTPALYFFNARALPAGILHLDADEWPRRGEGWFYQRDDPVLHIELRRWAELFLIAPLDANTLAKAACGLADNCLTCVWRAWDPARPVLLAPAMNTFMWDHPLTRRHLRQLIADHADAPAPPDADLPALVEWLNAHCPRLKMIGPITKRLACGDTGMGGMAEVPEIVAAAGNLLSSCPV